MTLAERSQTEDGRIRIWQNEAKGEKGPHRRFGRTKPIRPMAGMAVWQNEAINDLSTAAARMHRSRAFGRNQADMQLAQLFCCDFRRRAHQQIFGALVHREQHDLAQILLPAQ